MDPNNIGNLIHRPAPDIPELPKQNNNRKKVFIAALAVIVVGLGLYWISFGLKQTNPTLSSIENTRISGVLGGIRQNEFDVIIYSPGAESKLLTIKVSPATTFLKVDATSAIPNEQEIKFSDLIPGRVVTLDYVNKKDGSASILEATGVRLLNLPPPPGKRPPISK